MLLNLPFTKDKKEKPLPYYAIELSDEIAKVAVWQVDEGVVSVIRTSDVIQVTGSKMDDYLQAVDMAIATVTIDGELDPKEVLYGLPPEWVDENGVVAPRRSLLKYISDKMQLKPIGFVMIIDALIEYLRAKQSTPPSAIFIRFRKQTLDICLVTLGKIVKLESVGRSNDIVADVKEGLVRLRNKGQLPPRMILFDGYLDFGDITAQLMAESWEKELPFGHAPVIESLVRDMTVEAVAISAGKEAVKQTMKLVEQSVDEEITEVQDTNLSSQPITVPKKSSTDALPEGFSVGLEASTQEIIDTKLELESEVTEEVESQNNISDQDISDPVVVNSQYENVEIKSFDNKEFSNETGIQKKPSFFSNLNKFLKKLKWSKLFHKSPQVPSLNQPMMETVEIDSGKLGFRLPWWSWLVILIFLIVGIGSVGVWAYTSLPKAEIIVGIKSQVVEQEVSLTIAKDVTQLDEQNLIVPTVSVNASASGTQIAPTTGSKRIGKSAQGKVTVYNKTDKSKSFTKGTVLVGPGNLRYELGADIKVASKSAISTGGGETVTFGKEDVVVVAGDIGEEYNQTANKDFRFKDFGTDDFTAKNGEAIGGGESTEQKAVAKDDRTNVKDLLVQTLEGEATLALNKNLGNGLIVIDKTQETELDDITYDKKVGEAGSEINAQGVVSMTALAVNKDDFDRILLKALVASIPSNFQVTSQGLQSQITEITPIENEAETVKNKKKEAENPERFVIKVKAQVKIMPKLDFVQIKQSLRSKSPQIAEDFIKTLPNYSSHNISIKPNLPGPLNTMPSKTERITIMVEEVTGQ